MKHLFNIAIFLLMPVLLQAQILEQQRVDSLLVLVSKAKNDTDKINLLNLLSYAYFTIDPAEGIRYGEEGLTFAKKIGWNKGMAGAYNSLGANYWAKNDFLKAQDYYIVSLKLSEEIGDKAQIARSLLDIGDAYQSLYNYPKALEYFEKTLKIDKEIGDKFGMLGCFGNMASVYLSQEKYDKALEYYGKSLALAEESGNQRNISYFSRNIGIVYTKMGNYSQALKYEKKSLKIFKALNDKDDMAPNLGDIGDTYFQKGDYREALEYYRRALKVLEEFKGKTAKGYTGKYLGHIGKTYLRMMSRETNTLYNGSLAYSDQKNTIQESVVYLKKSIRISKSIDDWGNLQETYKNLSEVQALQGNYAAALDAYKQYTIYKDIVYNKERDKKLIRHELEYEYGRQKDSLNYLNNLQRKQLAQEKELGQFKLKQQWLYTIVAFVVLCLTGSYFFFRNRIQQLGLKNELSKEKAEKELKEAEYKSRMTDITFSALRSQMNPHFIFNCLNSIKLYTEQNNTQAASDYLTKFSKLIRNMLDNARADRIDLVSEVESLRLYLEMEAMRFKEKLQYTIKVDKDVDVDFIEIPPLLIQPYIENAIWHGLMHKEEGGIINIQVSQSMDRSLLIITVADNGIGRAKAAQLKSMEALKQKSYGTKLTSERIALINEKYKTGAEVIITDLSDENAQPCGTLVTIKLPVK